MRLCERAKNALLAKMSLPSYFKVLSDDATGSTPQNRMQLADSAEYSTVCLYA